MKMAFWGLFVIGLVACSTLGIGKTLERAGGSWTSPAMLAGMAIGAVILVVAVAFATGYRPALLPTDRSMVVALAVLMGCKVGVSALQVAALAVAKG